MSALAYAEDANCGTTDPKLTAEERAKLESDLLARGWREVKDVQWTPPCEDEVGMFFRVWKLEADTRQVVVAFRGTWGFKDWLYGNLHWFTRFLPMEDQYSRARQSAQRVFNHFPEESEKATRFYTTGHSLGGGLAQHVLYSYPNKVTQALAFDPTPVTGFADQSSANQISACECSSNELNGEPRIYRVYDAYEVLANLRIFHKTFLPPERHIQEVRFPNAASHSMKGLAFYLLSHATSATASSIPWYTGKGGYTSNESCTAAFSRSQRTSCEAKVTQDHWYKCPQ
jgi:pimeloyl-ACP methyl ester carboxylesterase